MLSITFSQNSVSDELFSSILKFLGKNYETQHLELSITDMDNNRSQSFFEVLCLNNSLKHLNIINSDVPIEIVNSFVNVLNSNNSIKKLYLHDCQMNKLVIEKTALTLKNICKYSKVSWLV